jgi:hypothetical protein
MRSIRLAVAGALAAAFPSAAVAQSRPPLHAPVDLAPMAGAFHFLGDVDLDGDLDAIAFQDNGSAIKTSFTVWTNSGTGALTAGAPVPLPANAGIHTLYADVDGDGRGDLVLSVGTNPPATGLLLFAGQPNGTFAPPVTVTLPGVVTRIDAGNGNGDGVTDLLVLHGGAFPGYTRWLFGAANLALTLGPAVVLPLAADHCAVDADGDGLDDVALAVDVGGTAPGDAVWFHLTTPTGFAPWATVPLPNSSMFAITTLDHDGDGDRDLLVTNGSGTSSMQATVCRNLAPGVWAPSTQTIASVRWMAPHVGDWNGDGRDDVGVESVFSPSFTRSLTLLQSSGNGFVPRYSVALGGGVISDAPGFGDLDGDGHLDFMSADSVWFGDGTFTAPFGSLNTGALTDWDGDGDQDSLAAGGLQLHDGNGVLTNAPLVFPPLPANFFYDVPRLLTDLDGDGRHEVLVGVFEQLFLQSVFRETHLLREVTDQQFVFVGLAAPAPLRLDHGVVDDTDGDGDADIVNADGLWLNNGSGFFTLQGPITTGYTPIGKGDVDGDGDQDLLATALAGTSVAVLHRTAPNTWSTTVLYTGTGSAIESSVTKRFADVDDDSDLDVVARRRVSSNTSVTLVFTNQNGVFTQALTLPHLGEALVGDVDGDGLTDLAFHEFSRLRVLRRVGPGLVYAPTVSFVTPIVNDLVDFDQDGDLDATGAQGMVRNTRFTGAAAGFRRQYGLGSLGAGGWRPLLSVRGAIREGTSPIVSLRHAPGGTAALLVVGSGATNVPSVILPGVQSYVAPVDLLLGYTLGGPWGQPGTGTLDLVVPVPPGLAGANLFLEFVLLDPSVAAAFTHSNGCQLSVGL